MNARFVHTNLAIRYLRASLKRADSDTCAVVREFSINDSIDNIAAEIYEEKPDALGFSCYIWNITRILQLIRRLRQVMPRALIFIGGPEVSFDAQTLLFQYPEIDAVTMGEGEAVLPGLIQQFRRGRGLWHVQGVTWRLRASAGTRDRLLEEIAPAGFIGDIVKAGADPQTRGDYIVTNPLPECLIDLNHLPNPYEEDEDFTGKLVYVETSRGCPYNCRFCISSTFRGVRYLEPETFRVMLRKLFAGGARTIKFVDRTFNANKKHALAILEVFRAEASKLMHSGQANPRMPRAHCEMAGELLDSEWLQYLANYPKGMIQLEIGVQSTHQPTLEAVNRPQHFSRWRHKIEALSRDIPVHLDLIAGLPLEGWEQFRQSFDDVYAARPGHLQLGFLKLLKGSGLWDKREEYGLICDPEPPYSILQTRHLSHDEILALRRVEEILEMYVNSGRFVYTWKYVLKDCPSAFDVFHAFAEFWHSNKWFRREWNIKSLFDHLWLFIRQDLTKTAGRTASELSARIETCRQALKFDYLLARQGEMPEYMIGAADHPALLASSQKSALREQIRTDLSWQRIIPELNAMDRRQWARATEIEYFTADIPAEHDAKTDGAFYLFYYTQTETLFYRIEQGDRGLCPK